MTQATVSPKDYIAFLGDFPELIGRFMCAFSSCEFWTYVILECLGSRQVRAELSGAALKVRLGRIEQLLRERAVPDDIRKDFVELHKQIRKLAKKRNLAAHNTPMAYVYEHERTGDLEIRWEMRHANNPALEVTREHLNAWFEEATKLEYECTMLHARLNKAAAEQRA